MHLLQQRATQDHESVQLLCCIWEPTTSIRVQDNIQLHDLLSPEYQTSGPRVQPQQLSFTDEDYEMTHADEDRDSEMVITTIRATGVARGLGRLPAGFYVVVHHSGREWKTENKLSSVNVDVVEWRDPIPIPSNLSDTIHLEVVGSFEFQPMLGDGERLRALTIGVEELLDRGAKELAFTFLPQDGDVASPCSSILVIVKRCKFEDNDPSMSRVLSLGCLKAEPRGELEDATNHGHNALLRHRKHGDQRDLELSIQHFQRAIDICLPDHPCRAAALSNLAMAKFTLCQFKVTDGYLEDILRLLRDALAARPVGHPDRPSTLIRLATVHFTQFLFRRDTAEDTLADAMLHEAMELSSTDSHEMQAVTSMLQLRAKYKAGPAQPESRSSVEQDSNLRSEEKDDGILLLQRFERLGNIADLDRAVALLEELVKTTSTGDDQYCARSSNLGIALLYRFEHLGNLNDLEAAIASHMNATNFSAHDHPDKPCHLNNLSTCLLTRFERLGQSSDLTDATSKLGDAVDLTPDSHAGKPGYLTNLGNAFLTRFEHLEQPSDLEDAILSHREAVKLVPDGHPDKPACLNNLGNSLFTRFRCSGQISDLEDAVSRFRDAVDQTPHGQPDKPSRLINLGTSSFSRFRLLGKLSDLEDAISSQKHATDLTPLGHPDKAARLDDLSRFLFTRFQHLGQLSDLEGAILKQKDAADLTPLDHPDKAARLDNFARSLFIRSQHPGQLSSLDDAILTLRDAVDLAPVGHLNKPTCLHNLGISYLTRFERLGQSNDLDAISALNDAVDLTPRGHSDKPARLDKLANSLLTRFKRLGRLSDLEDAVLKLRGSVDLTPEGHLDKPDRLSNLGNSLRSRFMRLGQPIDVDEAISRHKDAIALTPHGHPDQSSRLNDLGSCFVTRFQRLGKLTDLEEAISRYRDAVDVAPDGHPHKLTCLSNLGTALFTRFERLGHLDDLESAISMLQDVVDLTPDGHPEKSSCLSNLGSSFFCHFESQGRLNDLERTISSYRSAADLTPDDQPEKPGRLSNLGNSLRTRYEHLGQLTDLEDAILYHRTAVERVPHGHPEKPARLNNLATSLATRFEHFGQLSDLEEVISMLRDAVDFTPDDHTRKPRYLGNLGGSFLARFDYLGELSDLEDAISRHGDAVELTADGDPRKPTCLDNLGNSLLARFQRLGELRDLEDAISRHKDAANLTPDGHPDKPRHLSNLGNSFRTRFTQLGQLTDLEDAISVHLKAVRLTPDGHADKAMRLSNLSISFKTRFQHLGQLSDFEEAISRQKDALALTPGCHVNKPAYLTHLGGTFRIHFERFGELGSLERAISLYSHAACIPVGLVTVRFRASQNWISCARRIHHHSLLHAYSVAVSLLPQLAWIGLPLTDRYSELMRGADVVREAAAAALDSGYPETAVEWLEQARSIVGKGLFQLRTSHEELSAAHPDYARRLRELSTALDQASAIRERSLSALSEQARGVARRATESLQWEADRHRALAIERDKLLQEIRRLPGFERFLLRKRFSQLRASAHSGPVVILNAAETRCDALIVLANVDHVIHVPLSNFTSKKSIGLHITMKSLVRDTRSREAKVATRGRPRWETLLSPLWICVVKPVLDALAFSTVPVDLSRIFWCPTGPFAFLPIHAAGFYHSEYSKPGHKVFDFVVSSYVPALSILAQSPDPTKPAGGDLRLLAVPQPSSDGQSPLPGVITELAHIRDVIASSPSAQTTLVESSTGTVDEVSALMKDADWVHFACHGVQDGVNSGLCLADRRRLKLRDVVGLSRTRGGLAFLSACQTATGERNLADEAIHMAAGMLFAGYGGVVGTMWSISDVLAPIVTRDVYAHLFAKGTRPDYREAAWALHKAVEDLRDRGVSFSEWIPFIHVGV